ncbi:MAG: hypothetical protein K2N12_01915 [Helicobacter sp.]|nr:hypothetical protein [Helicobacter sp.]
MRLRTLVIVWAVFSLVVVLYTHTLTAAEYRYPLPFLLWGDEYEIVLPVAVWIVLPVAVFFAIVCVAALVNKVRAFLFSSRVRHDYAKLIEQIYAQTIGTHESLSFKNPKIDEISRVLQRFELKPLPNTVPSGVDKIDAFLNAYKALGEGEVVDMRQFRVPNDSPLVALERQNRLAKNPQYALEILKRNTESADTKRSALLALLQTTTDVAPYIANVEINDELARALLESMLGKQLGFDSDKAEAFVQLAHYDSKQILVFMRRLKKILSPDMWLAFAEQTANKNEEAELAYLYVLADLEMIEQLKERLKHHTPEEFVAVRAFVELRENGKNYPLQAFFCL